MTSAYSALSSYRVSSQRSTVGFVQTANTGVNVGQAVATARPTAPATQSGLPEGLLLSVSAPAPSNSQATVDYRSLRTALQSGNLTAAQQAYTRLQIDLELTYSAQGSSQSSAVASAVNSGTTLNTVA
jgi:hypothetical protein